MRPVLPGDVAAAARRLHRLPPARRPTALAAILRRAALAEAHLAATGRAHPRYGTGSLMAASGPPSGAEPRWDEPDYARCLILVLEALVGRAQSAGVTHQQP